MLQVKKFMVSLKAMTHEFFIRKTLTLAARARGRTSPNPMVGALLVRNGRVVSEGYHKKAGTPHAEVIAIDNAGEKAGGATLYVSLEPCCHTDKKTPPCTQKIISSGIRKVVIAMEDPNPKVSGKGIETLKRAGITVISGILEDKARELNEHYIKYITTGTPFVIMKVAMTLDGKIATPEGESKWITGEKARKEVHRLRGNVDALMTAIGTVKADNPSLTCRTADKRDPMRIIIDPGLEISLNSRVLSVPPETILVTREEQTAKRDPVHPAGVSAKEDRKRVVSSKGAGIIEYKGDKCNLGWLMKELGKKGIMSLLIEGGSALNSYCLEQGIVDKVMFFIAPKIIGGRDSFPAVGGRTFRKLDDAFRIRDVKTRRIGEDILMEGYLQK